MNETTRGTWVTYSYCISILVMSFRLNSSPIFVADGESRVARGLPYTLISLCFGWWGFPWGLIYTPMSLIENFDGGTLVVQLDEGGSATPIASHPVGCANCGSLDIAHAVGRGMCRSCGYRWGQGGSTARLA